MASRIDRARYGPVYLTFTWVFGLSSWGFVSHIVGLNTLSIERVLARDPLVATIILLLIVLCAFLRNRSAQSITESSEDALTLCVVLLYPQELAVALMATAGMLVSISMLTSRRLRQHERGSLIAYVGEVVFQGGLMAFVALTGNAVFRALYPEAEPLRTLAPADLWRIPCVFGSMYLIRLAILFLHSWSRGLPLVAFIRATQALRSLTVALTETANLLLGLSMAVTYTGLGLPVFLALGGVLVAMVKLLAKQAEIRSELLSHVAELRVLNGVSRALSDGPQPREKLLAAIQTQSLALFGADSFALYLTTESDLSTSAGAEEPGRTLALERGAAPSPGEQGGVVDPEQIALPLAEWCLRTHRTLRIDNAPRELGAYHYGWLARDFPFMSWLGTPLEANGQIHGVISVASRESKAFSEQHQELLEALGQQVVAAMERARLFEMAHVDALTGLLTPRSLRQRLADEFERARVSERFLSLIMVDIDHFKRVNDGYGHEVGNEVLKQVAAIVSGRLRESDIAGRYGGEEFTVLLPGAPAARSLEIAERLREAIAGEPLQTAAGPIAISASFGVATFPILQVVDANALLAAADAALYESKHGGRNRVTEAKSDAGAAQAAGPGVA